MPAPFSMQVARSVPFDPADISFRKDNTQEAIQEIHQQTVIDPTFTTTTASGSLTLTDQSTTYQVIKGSASGFTINLADATTLFNGYKLEIANLSSRSIQIKNGAGTNLLILGQTSILYAVLSDNSTSAGNWVYFQAFASTTTGTVNYEVINDTPFTTTSSSYQIIPGFTITPTAGTYACWFNASIFHTTTPRGHWWGFFRGGVIIPDSERRQDTSHSNQTMMDSTMTIAQFDGAQTLDVRYRIDTNGATTVNQRSMILIRLGV